MAGFVVGDFGEQLRRCLIARGGGLSGEAGIHGFGFGGLPVDGILQIRRVVADEADELGFPGEVVGQFGVGGAGECLSSLLVTGLLSLG